ncbi:MAG: DUF1015 domain-containing protein [Treponemataceae bacterium]|nr:DUF1015 domain-containing protein [Treponemataceae bacterium]
MKTLEDYGIKVPAILMPNKKVDLKKWAVIACDQYTQDRDYWKKVTDFVGDEPSTLKITLPEVYLNDGDKAQRIEKINRTMQEYLSNGVFADPVNNMIYIERTTGYGRVRKGLVTAIDLESYDWKPEEKAQIRATEATILERIPPRVEIRKNAPIELPHIMLLVNDSAKKLVEATGNAAKKDAPLYQTELMCDSGKISGWKVSDELAKTDVLKELERIEKEQTQDDGSVFLFAVGDGNHSLATAKTIWNNLKAAGAPSDSPARYALVEIVNIYDEGLTFEPIHRVLFNVDAQKLLSEISAKLGGNVCECSNDKELEKAVGSSKADFGFVYEKDGKKTFALLKTPITDLAVSHLQPALDEFLKANGNSKEDIDYIHGSDEVFRLGGKDGAVSILLPPIAKDTFFATIAKSGTLPRKSFSMGEASEKRFYMEARQL